MADAGRNSPGALTILEALRETPQSFELFAALRAIQAAHLGKPRLGTSEWIGDDPLRLKQEPTLGFQPSEVLEYRAGPEGVPELVTVAFGLFGANGPMPHHITERAVESAAQRRQRTLPDFADLFHHRLLLLLYRAWEAGQIAVSRDRPGAEDAYGRFLLSLVGAGADEFRDRDALPDDTRRYLSGRLSKRSPSADDLAALVAMVTGTEVRTVEFVGEWLAVPPEQRSAVGRAGASLGVDTLLGDRQYSVQSRVRLRIGPLTLERYRQLLPTGRLFPMVRDAIRAALGLAHGWELQLVLAAEEKPPLKLDGTCAIGWDSWLGEDVQFADADDLRLDATISEAGS